MKDSFQWRLVAVVVLCGLPAGAFASEQRSTVKLLLEQHEEELIDGDLKSAIGPTRSDLQDYPCGCRKSTPAPG